MWENNKFNWKHGILLLLGLAVSYYCFQFSVSFFISVFFILFIAIKVIKNLDEKNLLSVIGIIGPIISDPLKEVFFSNFEYSFLIKINALLHNIISVTKDDIDVLIIYGLLSLIVIIIDSKDSTVIGKHTLNGDPEFRRKSFKEQNERFCEEYLYRIENIKNDLKWNDADDWAESQYIPIAAEVLLSKGKEFKRYDDILKCLNKNKQRNVVMLNLVKYIRHSVLARIRLINISLNALEKRLDQKNVYLILGEPGSGKSHSLLKLCADLLRESHITGKTPVYISLKTWKPDMGEWNEDNLPTKRSLIQHIEKELLETDDPISASFVSTYFNRMLEDGRWYFIFDSFDEMPCLIGSKKTDKLVNYISRLLNQFLSGPGQCGGIIASRTYNSPSESLKQTYKVTLKSFDNNRIRKMLKSNFSTDAGDIVKKIFERQNLVELCRNPFYLELLIEYLKKNKMALPVNQFDLFEDLIKKKLENCHQINELGLSEYSINSVAEDLSIMMQNDARYGLEIPIEDVYERLKDRDLLEKSFSILEKVKVCRIGGDRQTISFVHRRLQEFFYVKGIINGKVRICETDYESILNNTGKRDALVLYCQIGDQEDIQNIVNYCCNVIESGLPKISSILNDGCVELVNSLYFLTEALSNNKDALCERKKLIISLKKYLNNETDLVVLMAIVKSLALLTSEDIEETILDVFRLRNRWLNNAIISNCQVVKKLSIKTEIGFCGYFEDMNLLEAIENYRNIDFSLSLVDCFRYVRIIHLFYPIYLVVCFFAVILGLSNIIVHIMPMAVMCAQYLIKIANQNKIYEVICQITSTGISVGKYNETLRKIDEVKNQTLPLLASTHFFLCVFLLINRVFEYWDKSDVVEPKEDDCKTRDGSYDKDKNESNGFQRTTIGIKKIGYLGGHYIKEALFVSAIGSLGLYSGNDDFPYIMAEKVLFVVLIAFPILQIIHEIVEPIFAYFKVNGIKAVVDDMLYMALDSRDYFKKLLTFATLKKLIVKVFKVILIIIAVLIGVVIIGLLYGVAAVIMLLVPAYLICLIFGIETSTEIVVTMMILVYLALLLLLGANNLLMALWDYRWLKKPQIDSIDRKTVVATINKIHSKSVRRKYVQLLRQYDVTLVGNWPDDRREVFTDDVLNTELALWDCDETAINSYITTAI